MTKKLRMMLRLGLIVVLIAKDVCYQGASFVIEMEDIRFDLWIISLLYARSRLDCSKTCEIHGTCLSFQYSSLNGQCRLFNTIFLHQDAGVSDIGWQYYIVSNRRCRYPFIDGRVLDICFMFAGFHNLTEAKKKCAANNSNIISITSAEQNKFLSRLAGTFSYLSLAGVSYKRPFIQGSWGGTAWILDNGTPLVYTNWDIGHPMITSNRRYIKFLDGQWRATIPDFIRSVFCTYQP